MWLPERSVTMAGTITSVVCTLIVGCLAICASGFSCPRHVSTLDKTTIAKAHPRRILFVWICTGPPKEREAELSPWGGRPHTIIALQPTLLKTTWSPCSAEWIGVYKGRWSLNLGVDLSRYKARSAEMRSS